MKFVKNILIVLILSGSLQGYAQVFNDSIRVATRPAKSKNAIMLRWLPNNYSLLEKGAKYGYKIKRKTIRRNGQTVSPDVTGNITEFTVPASMPVGVTLPETWKPYLLSGFQKEYFNPDSLFEKKNGVIIRRKYNLTDSLNKYHNNGTLPLAVDSLALRKYVLPTQYGLPIYQDSIYHVLIANTFYGSYTSDSTGVRIVKDSSITNLAQAERDQKFDMLVLAADMKFSAAKLAGLGYTDVTALETEQYIYEITPLKSDGTEETNVLKGTIKVSYNNYSDGGIYYYDLPKPMKPKVILADKSMDVRWKDNRNNFTAYSVEKATDSTGTKTRLNKLLLVNLTAIDSLYFVDRDTTKNKTQLKSGFTYYYRVIGKSPFDEESVSGFIGAKYTEKAQYIPRITESGPITSVKNNYRIKWEFKPPIIGYTNMRFVDNKYLDASGTEQTRRDTLYDEVLDTAKIAVTRYSIRKASKDTAHVEFASVGPTVDTLRFADIKKATYVVVVAISPTHGEIYSQSVLLSPKDDTPPNKPITLTAEVIRNTTNKKQLVKVKWKRNEKVYPEDSDVSGYKIFKANRLSKSGKIEEPSLISDTLHTWKRDADSLSVYMIDTLAENALSLNPRIYYKIQAFDKRFNHSLFSDSIVVKNPNRAKPSQPVFKSYNIIKDGVNLIWVKSNDDSLNTTVHKLIRLDEPFNTTNFSPLVTNDFKLPSDTVYLDKTVLGDTRYAYYLMAITADADTILSPPLILDIPGAILDKALSSTNFDFKVSASRLNGQNELKWSLTGQSVTEYQLYRSANSNPVSSWKTVTGSDVSVNDREVQGNMLYKYSIRAVFADGSMSSWKNVEVLFPDECSTTLKILRKDSLSGDKTDEACEEIELKPGFDSGQKVNNQINRKVYITNLEGQPKK